MIILHDWRGYLTLASPGGYARHMASIGIAGAGFSGAVIARELAEAGHICHVFDTRDHVGGNCHTERHDTGVLVHRYGPHIFHTDNERVWGYMNRYGDMVPYDHKVKTTVEDTVFSLPVNLHTINQVYGTSMSPTEAHQFITGTEAIDLGHEPENFEEQALAMVGRRLYELFFEGYTRKQWGVSPTSLPASILKRLPLRFNYEDSYFNHPHQAIPAEGYTPIVEAILDHEAIQVTLKTALTPASASDYDHVIWSGPLDAYFDYDLGRLRYRTLDFEEFVTDGDFQGTPVMNYGDEHVPYTRITEHKHFAPGETHTQTVCFREFSRKHQPDDVPYYPVRLVDDQQLLDQYEARAAATLGVTFVGRLGTYRYLDMDVTIAEALDAADALKALL
jgi:UDP-galactopyranose mutase